MNDIAKPVELAVPDVTLVKRVSKRLFVALLALLLLVAIVVAVSALTAHVSVTYVVFPAGVIGGFVGIQRRVKKLSREDLALIADSWLYTVLSPLVGGILAIVLFVLFLSGLLQGDLFPAFVPPSASPPSRFTELFQMRAESVQDYAKLIFWAFVAGYSERFVTDVIGQFEQSGNSARAS
jgi:hypothetical protein